MTKNKLNKITHDINGINYRINIETNTISDNYNTYKIYYKDNSGDVSNIVSMYGIEHQPASLYKSNDIYTFSYNNDIKADWITSPNPSLYALYSGLQYTSYYSIGDMMNENTSNYSGSSDNTDNFRQFISNNDYNLYTIDNIYGESIYVQPLFDGSSQLIDNELFLMQITTNGDLEIKFWIQKIMKNNSQDNSQEQVDIKITLGCTAEDALNYNLDANIDNNSCQYNVCSDKMACNYNLDIGNTILNDNCVYNGINAILLAYENFGNNKGMSYFDNICN